MSRRTYAVFFAPAAIVALGLAGCGGPAEPSPPPPPPSCTVEVNSSQVTVDVDTENERMVPGTLMNIYGDQGVFKTLTSEVIEWESEIQAKIDESQLKQIRPGECVDAINDAIESVQDEGPIDYYVVLE